MLTPLPIRTARSGWGFLFIDMAKIGYPKPKKNGFPKSFGSSDISSDTAIMKGVKS